MQVFARLAAALLVAAGLCSAAADPECSVTTRLSAPKTVKAGRKFAATASIKNTGATALDGLYLQFQFPDYMLPMAGRASAFATKNGAAPVIDGRYIYFREMRLPPRKHLRIKVTVGVPTCQAADKVQLQGLVYRLDAGGNILCTSTAAPATTTVAHKKKIINSRHSIVGNCTAPGPAPTQGYALIGTDTRCIQAEPLDPLNVRTLSEAEEARGRHLMPTASPAELQCWACCGFKLNSVGPYFFNVATDGQCYCCAECDPLYAPDWTAYSALGAPAWSPISDSQIPNRYQKISGSADGKILVAMGTNLWTRSEDYGKTWTQIPNANLFSPGAVHCDPTGMTCVSTTIYGASFARGSIYRSVDGGATWNVVLDKVGPFRDVTCDPTGTKWFAALNSAGFGQNGLIYKSVDSGATFTAISGSGLSYWGTVACDASFLRCIAASSELGNGDPGSIYVTNDGFQTITLVPNTPRGIFWDSAMSVDGQQILVVQYESDDDGPRTRGLIWRSSNGGNSFEQTDAPSRYYYSVSCDEEFHMCAAAPNGQGSNYDPSLMLLSCDGGHTWSEVAGTDTYWASVKVNADGGFMYAVNEFGPSFVYSYPLPVA